VAADVGRYLERFAASPLPGMIASARQAFFELPFAYDWDGVPVHGTIDLALNNDAGWHVIDFKTDAISGDSVVDAAAPYLPQLGLYGLALEQATGARPWLTLALLQTGRLHALDWPEVEQALVRTRQRVDAGARLDLSAESPSPEEGE
jgi:hypothetical protein